MAVKIPKPGPPLPRDRAMHASVKRLVDLHNAAPTGILIGSDTVVVEPLKDGRYRLHLHPSIKAKFE